MSTKSGQPQTSSPAGMPCRAAARSIRSHSESEKRTERGRRASLGLSTGLLPVPEFLRSFRAILSSLCFIPFAFQGPDPRTASRQFPASKRSIGVPPVEAGTPGEVVEALRNLLGWAVAGRLDGRRPCRDASPREARRGVSGACTGDCHSVVRRHTPCNRSGPIRYHCPAWADRPARRHDNAV